MILRPSTINVEDLLVCFHTAHVIEEAREARNGVEFLTTTRDDWKDSMFGCHITWHLTLYYFGEPVRPSLIKLVFKNCQKLLCVNDVEGKLMGFVKTPAFDGSDRILVSSPRPFIGKGPGIHSLHMRKLTRKTW